MHSIEDSHGYSEDGDIRIHDIGGNKNNNIETKHLYRLSQTSLVFRGCIRQN